MRKGKKKAFMSHVVASAVLFWIIVLFGGCSMEKEIEEPVDATLVFMEEEPVVNYELPRQFPGIVVDRYGYRSDGEKEAYLTAGRLPEYFSIMDVDTGAEVYRGRLSGASYDEKTQNYSATLSFDNLKDGRYYLECEYVGQSYPFTVGDGIYRQLFEELCGMLESEGRNGTGTVEDMLALVIAFEWHDRVFLDDDGDGTPDVLFFLKSWIQGQDFGALEDDEIAIYTAFLAKFSYLYRQYDITYATECLQMASTIFAKLPEDADRGFSFLALTELYRATGLAVYGNRILEYSQFFQENQDCLEEPAYLYGVMTYLSTKQRVNLTLCDMFMRRLMVYGDEIVGESAELLAMPGLSDEEANEILSRAQELSCANYVLESRQYYRLLEDYMHYLLGRNRYSEVYYPEHGDRKYYLLLTAQLLDMEILENEQGQSGYSVNSKK